MSRGPFDEVEEPFEKGFAILQERRMAAAEEIDLCIRERLDRLATPSVGNDLVDLRPGEPHRAIDRRRIVDIRGKRQGLRGRADGAGDRRGLSGVCALKRSAEAIGPDSRAHRAIHDQDPLGEEGLQRVVRVLALVVSSADVIEAEPPMGGKSWKLAVRSPRSATSLRLDTRI